MAMRNKKDIFKVVQTNDVSAVISAIAAGEDINARNEAGNTPLHYACERGYTEIVNLLLNSGADVNAQNNGGHTPLHWACWRAYAVATRLLLEKGADPGVKNASGGIVPLDHILSLAPNDPRREEIIDLFRQYTPEAVMEKFCTMGQGM